MTEIETARLMLLCGGLHDIAEKTNDQNAAKQVTDIQIGIEKLIGHFPITQNKYSSSNEKITIATKDADWHKAHV